MTNHTCDKCGRELDANTVFCPHCGAAVIHSNTSAPVAPPVPPSSEPAPIETPQEESTKKFDYKKLIPPAAVVLAVILTLILGWDTVAGIFSPREDPQLSTTPSTEQTSPSQTYAYNPDAKPTKSTAPSTEPATQPTETEPPATEPPTTDTATQPTEATIPPELMPYQELLAITDDNYYNRYNLLTMTTFSHPREASLRRLFSNWPKDYELTEAERAYFGAIDPDFLCVNAHRMTLDDINAVMLQYLGITLAESDMIGFDRFYYWEETGYYYFFTLGLTGNPDITVTAIHMIAPNTVNIKYTTDGKPWTMNLYITDEVCHVLSNLPDDYR